MSDTNWAVQPQKMVRDLKFRIKEKEGLYYLFSENKGPDQLCSYPTADLRLCFHICKSRFSHDAAHLGNFKPSSLDLQPGLCWTWLESQKTGFVMTWLVIHRNIGTESLLNEPRCEKTSLSGF